MDRTDETENHAAQGRDKSVGRRARSGARRRACLWAAWLALAFWGVLSSAWAWAGAAWPVDLAANLTAQWAALGAVALVVALSRRRLTVASVLALCVALAGLGLALVPRAHRAGPAGSPEPVRVLVVNAAASNDHADDLAARLRESQADVMVILETPENLLAFLRSDPELRGRLPFAWVPDRAGAGYTVVLTRWPQRGGDRWQGDESSTFAGGVRAMRVDRPDGPFMLLTLHPGSPRSAARWAEGNQLVGHAADVINTRMRPEGLPVVAAGDLNSSPTGHRSRLLSGRAGLRRAKPLALASGTWPSWGFWPLRVAIDDVFVDEEVGLVSWRTVRMPGSDHSAVEAVLVIPPP